MLVCYGVEGGCVQEVPTEVALADTSRIVWIDLNDPSDEEETRIEKLFAISIPTSDEMHEIEVSNRLYQENGALYATFTIVTKSDALQPEMASITLVLAGNTLISVRYSTPLSFRMLQSRLQKLAITNGIGMLEELLEAVVNRMADMLESVGHQMDGMTQTIFSPDKTKKPDYEEILRHIGLKGDAVSKARESLVSMNRMAGFLLHSAPFSPPAEHDRMRTLVHDIAALSDHANFLSSKVTFMLDATLGMVNIEQTAIIKIVSVGTIVLMPPTLVASIYGMNFDVMPELHWILGYPMALLMMILAALLPYALFKSRGWL